MSNINWEKMLGVPDLSMMLEMYGRKLSAGFNCHRVGKIIAFNSNDLTCDIKLLDKIANDNFEQEYGVIYGVPLLIYGTESAGLTFGDVTGSECLVHFNDTDIDNWLKTGETYAPNSLRQHDFNDGFAELRLYDKQAAQNFNYDTQATVLRNGNCTVRLTDAGVIEISNGSAVISMSGENITITGNVTVTGTVVSNTDVKTGTISLKDHVHGGVRSGPTTTEKPQ